MVSHHIPPAYSGAGAQAMSLAVALVGRGHEVTIATAGFRGEARLEDTQGVHVRRLGRRADSRTGRASFYISLALFLARRARRYDLVHVHGVFWPAVIAAAVTSRTDTPLVLKMTRDGDDDAVTLEHKRSSGGVLGRARFYPLSVADRVVSVNRSMESGAIGIVGPGRSVLLPNAVDTAWMRPPTKAEHSAARAHSGLGGSAPVVLFPGGYMAHKGLATLIEALDPPVACAAATVAIVGLVDSADPEMDLSLRALVQQRSQAPDGVRYVELGLVDRATMRLCYWAADVFVLLSEREGNPNSLLEAMSCGRPCIATAIPGVADMGAPAKAVVLVPLGDVDAARRALCAAFQSPGDGAGAAGRAHVVSHCSIGALAQRYDDLYASVLSGERAVASSRAGGR